MEKTLALERPVDVAGVTVVPVVETRRWVSARGFLVSRQPVAVVVVTAGARRTFRITGEEITADELVKEAPGLEGLGSLV